MVVWLEEEEEDRLEEEEVLFPEGKPTGLERVKCSCSSCCCYVQLPRQTL